MLIPKASKSVMNLFQHPGGFSEDAFVDKQGFLTSTDNIGEIDRSKDPFYRFNESSFMKIHLTSSLNLLMK